MNVSLEASFTHAKLALSKIMIQVKCLLSLSPSFDFYLWYLLVLFLFSFSGSPPNRKRPANEKATDDYHYEKFKKMNRRY